MIVRARKRWRKMMLWLSSSLRWRSTEDLLMWTCLAISRWVGISAPVRACQSSSFQMARVMGDSAEKEHMGQVSETLTAGVTYYKGKVVTGGHCAV